MTDSYETLNSFWRCHLDGTQPLSEEMLLGLLKDNGVVPRQKDGTLRMYTVSRPTSVSSAYVLGLRYDKRDGTQTEDHHLFRQGEAMRSLYRRDLEREFPEYRGAHKQQVPYISVGSSSNLTNVNTVSFLAK